jgi:hypothetical protein
MRQAKPRQMIRHSALWLGVAVCIAGCDPLATGADRGAPAEPGVIRATRHGPADAPEGSCWGRTVSPAVIETVTEQVQIAPARTAPDGSVIKPPVYRSEKRQQIVTPRVDTWFETPCVEKVGVDFIASLQRALAVRRYYEGPITGVTDPETAAAIQRFQRSTGGPDSPVLSLQSARTLGLIAVDRSTLQ